MARKRTEPTIGRVVHYVSYGSKDGRVEGKCRAAFVTEVHPNYAVPAVGLAVFSPNGMHMDRDVRQSEDDHTGGTWHWPCVRAEEETDEDR